MTATAATAAPITLRDYQSAAIDSVMRDLLQGGARSTLIDLATGTGKTSTFSELVRLLLTTYGFRRALVLAHRRELIDQAAARLKLFGLTVGIERGQKWSKGDEQVVVASVQTLRGPRLAAFAQDEFDIIVTDECHHATAKGYRDIYEHFYAAKLLGVTATPDRSDGVPMGTAGGGVFDTCAYRYTIEDAVRAGHLVPVRGIRVEVAGMDLSKVRQHRFITDAEGKARKLKTPDGGWGPDTGAETGSRVAGEVRELHIGDLGAAVIAPEAIDGVVRPLLQFTATGGAGGPGVKYTGLRTVVFAVNVAHAEALAKCIGEYGETAVAVHSKMSDTERSARLKRHQSGEAQYLINVGVAIEGYDDQAIECVAMARPTQSRTLYTQAAGRALRLLGATLEESIARGKSEALLIDFTGVSCEFDLVGPEDVLGGALVGPVKVIRKHKPAAQPALALVPAPAAPPAPAARVRVDFTTRVVELLRTVGPAVGKVAGKATARTKAAVAGTTSRVKRAAGWLARLFTRS